jgi:hypothetical protein
MACDSSSLRRSQTAWRPDLRASCFVDQEVFTGPEQAKRGAWGRGGPANDCDDEAHGTAWSGRVRSPPLCTMPSVATASQKAPLHIACPGVREQPTVAHPIRSEGDSSRRGLVRERLGAESAQSCRAGRGHARSRHTHAHRRRRRKYLGMATQTLAKLRWSGDSPPFFKIGRRVLYDQTDLATWLDARKRRSTSV